MNPWGRRNADFDRLKAAVVRGHPCAMQDAACFPDSCGEAAAAHVAFLGV